MLLHQTRVTLHLDLRHVLVGIHVAVGALVRFLAENHLLVVRLIGLVLIDHKC